MTPSEAIDAYVAFFEDLSPDSLDRLNSLCVPEVHFRDPFNDVRGAGRYRAVLAKMFDDVAEPRFEITDRAYSGPVCYLRWTFTFRNPAAENGRQRIEGMSEVHLSADGKVTAHIDHWDAAEIYARVPVLGALLRMVKRRLSVGSPTAY